MSLGLALASVAASSTNAHAQSQRQVTFAKDVAPILQRSCQSCPNGPAPQSLVTYEDVRPWARAIQQRTAAREMPPWYIDKNVGIQKFKNDSSLRDEEIATLAAWVANGAQNGNPADMPQPRRFAGPNEWTIGEPDLIVSSPVVTVAAMGADLSCGPSGLPDTADLKVRTTANCATRST